MEALLKLSLDIGADYIATGHYARIERLENGRYAIRNSVTARKDQTYALYNLTQEQLAHTQMPVGAYTKEEIRQIAEKAGLPVAHKKDSQEICFVPDKDYAGFIEKSTGEKIPAGNYVKKDGTVIGEHKGIIHYTIGQRKGLNLSMGHPVFVTEIRPKTNEVVIGENEELFVKSLVCDRMNYMAMEEIREGEVLTGKIRYNHPGAPCTLKKLEHGRVQVDFLEPQRAVTPGQAVVLYQGEYVAGGGIILGPVKEN